ncbi:MAG TPA: response regulator [Elusimicrobiales bacterium]|nr:response regulator [Elusimicrobiales bacterium]
MPWSLLIVEDNEETAALLSGNFQAKGVDVRTALNGAAGVEQARTRPPDVMLLDFNLPDMTGVDVYNELLKDPLTAVIPVVFLSSTLLGMIKRMVTDNPRVRFLKKPCGMPEIEKCVYELLALPKTAPPPAPPPPGPAAGPA